MFYNGNKVFPNQRLDILARKPTPEEAWFRKLYYVDTPEAIERKIRYIFREGYCKWKHPEYPGAGEAMFVFYLSNGPGKMDNDKALEVCGSK